MVKKEARGRKIFEALVKGTIEILFSKGLFLNALVVVPEEKRGVIRLLSRIHPVKVKKSGRVYYVIFTIRDV